MGCPSFTRQGPNSPILIILNYVPFSPLSLPPSLSLSLSLSLSHMMSPPPSHHITMCIYSLLLSGLLGQQASHHHHHHTLLMVYLNSKLSIVYLFMIMEHYYFLQELKTIHISKDLSQLCVTLKQGQYFPVKGMLNVGFRSRFHLIPLGARSLTSLWI